MAGGGREREFRLTDGDFTRIAQLVEASAGIRLPEAKREMVYSRLSRRLRELKLTEFSAYLELLEQDDAGTEMGQFINAITTNLTAFFRENHHFEFLREQLLPALAAQGRQRRLRIWSAGCSTGEEPYSIAMVVREVLGSARGWDAKILATDLDTNVLATASRGLYPLERTRGIGEGRLGRFFLRGRGDNAGWVRVKPELQELISFRQLNLLGPWPLRGPFDLIFCRNVVIYFSKETQRRLFDRYADILKPDGHLFIGHSESLFKVCERFRLVGSTTYQRVT